MSPLPDAGGALLKWFGRVADGPTCLAEDCCSDGTETGAVLRSGAARSIANVIQGLLCLGFAEFWSLDPSVAPQTSCTSC